MFPADLLLLDSSDKNGNAYVETSNLDGERNLKCKSAFKEFYESAREFGLNSLSGISQVLF